MEKLIYRKASFKQAKGSIVIKIDKEAAAIIEAFATETQLSKTRIASDMIKFASEYTEVIEDEEE